MSKNANVNDLVKRLTKEGKEGIKRFSKKLRRMGIDEKLEQLGAEDGDMEQFNRNNMMNGGIIQNTMEGNVGVNGMGLNNNGFVGGQIMGQGVNIPGYDFNYGVGLQGQNMNQMIAGMNTNQSNGI